MYARHILGDTVIKFSFGEVYIQNVFRIYGRKFSLTAIMAKHHKTRFPNVYTGGTLYMNFCYEGILSIPFSFKRALQLALFGHLHLSIGTVVILLHVC